MTELSEARRAVLAKASERDEISGVQLINLSTEYGGKHAGGRKWGATVLRKLAGLGYVERVGSAIPGNPSYFQITDKGREYLWRHG